MDILVITDIHQAGEYINKQQKVIELLQKQVVTHNQKLVEDPQFRLYGNTVQQIHTMILFYENHKCER